jgi:O-antigen ligase
MPVAPQAPAITSRTGRGGRAQKILGVGTEADPQTRRSAGAAGLLTGTFVVAVIAAAGLQQGAFFVRGQIAVAALIAAALVTALPIRRALDSELRAPLIAAALLAGWTVVRAVPVGSLRAASGEAALLAGVAAILIMCRRLDRGARRLTIVGLLGFGLFLAITAWAGVAWHLTPWALTSEGLWRGASTVTYANALAGVLVPLTLTALALLSAKERSVPLALVVTLLLLGVATTLSRAGALALLAGLTLLISIRGVVVLRSLLAPVAGACVALSGLLPSMPVGSNPRPGLAAAALAVGMGVTAALVSLPWRRSLVAATVLVLIATFASWSVTASGGSLRSAGRRIAENRIQVSSPPRSRLNAAALELVAEHPLTGVGPSRVVIESKSHGRLRVQQYVHNEYVQVLAEVGAIGAVLLAALLVTTLRLLWRSRPIESGGSLLWAGTAAACVAAVVHAGFDFVWHVPVVLLTLSVLIGLAVTPVTSTNDGDPAERRL